mgnify:CR=1 FL=1
MASLSTRAFFDVVVYHALVGAVLDGRLVGLDGTVVLAALILVETSPSSRPCSAMNDCWISRASCSVMFGASEEKRTKWRSCRASCRIPECPNKGAKRSFSSKFIMARAGLNET